MRKRGYADAASHPRQVVVDHLDHTVEATFHVAAGDLVRLGGLNVVTEGRTNPAWVATLAPWKKGDIYDPDKVARLEQRLRDASALYEVHHRVAGASADKAVDGLRPW